MPFDFFCTELITCEPQRRLQSINRLRVIAMALGPEKTRSDLLTFLMGEMVRTRTSAPPGGSAKELGATHRPTCARLRRQENGKCSDEVLVAIAFNLGRMFELVGPVRPVALESGRGDPRAALVMPLWCWTRRQRRRVC